MTFARDAESRMCLISARKNPVDISKPEQRDLHVLAQGGCVHFTRLPNGKIFDITCFSRDGHDYIACALTVFEKLKNDASFDRCSRDLTG